MKLGMCTPSLKVKLASGSKEKGSRCGEVRSSINYLNISKSVDRGDLKKGNGKQRLLNEDQRKIVGQILDEMEIRVQMEAKVDFTKWETKKGASYHTNMNLQDKKEYDSIDYESAMIELLAMRNQH